MANSAVRSSRACTLCAFVVVLMSCTPVAMAVDWEPMPDGMQGEAEAAAEFAVKYMNFHSIFRGSGTLTTLLSASHLPTDGTGDVRMFLTMDVDVGGENKITMAEVYRRPGAVSYQVLLPGAIKNRKSSLPERMTSLTDRWLKVSTDDAFVKEGAHRIDTLLKDSQILLPVDNVAPVIKGILHAEARGRDIGIELSELARVKSTSTNTVQESKVAIVKLESRLIQKLQVKKLAYDDPGTDKSILSSVDSEVASLEKQLDEAKNVERKSGERADKAVEAIKQLSIQDSEAQQAAMSGSKVENSRNYLYLVLQYSVLDKSVERLFKKSIMGYKDQQGMWKIVHQEDYPS